MKRDPEKYDLFEAASRVSGNTDYYRQIWRLLADNRRWFPAVIGLLFYAYINWVGDQMDKAEAISGGQAEETRPAKNPWALEK